MNRLVYPVAMLISFLLSYWINSHEQVINPDAICYLISAEVMDKVGFSAGMHVCSQASWPFYSYLIALTTKFTGLAYVNSAYLLDSLFSALSVITFIAIIKQLGGTTRVLWLAAAVILLSHEFNSVRQYVVRDHGYLAFYLLSLFTLLKFIAHPRYLTAIIFSVCLLIAALFRIEGLIFLALLPWLVWFDTSRSLRFRALNFLKLNTLSISLALMVVPYLIVKNTQLLSSLGRLPELWNQLHDGYATVVMQIQHMKEGLVTSVIGPDSAHEAGLLLGLLMLVWYLVSVMVCVSWIYGLLVLVAWLRRIPRFLSADRLVLYGYLALNIIITLVFLFERLFLSNRYLMGLSLVLMLWVPFVLVRLRWNLTGAVVGLLIAVSAAGGLFEFGYSKAYIRQAGDWLASNMPATAHFYANDMQLMYYSKHFGTGIFQVTPSDNYDFIALRSGRNKDDPKIIALITQTGVTPIQVFMNKRGDKVSIYQMPKGNKQ